MEDNLYLKVIDLLYHSVCAEGGDGDALWLSKYRPLMYIQTLVENYNKENNLNWEVIKYENYLSWGVDQEWVTITDNRAVYEEEANVSWRILKLEY